MSNDLPDGWESLSLAEAVEPGALIQYGILQPGPDITDGVPYIRPTEIQADQIQLEDLRRTTPKIAENYRRSALAAGDVLLSIVGTIGKVAIVPPALNGANITQSSARLRPRRGVVSSELLAWFLRSPNAKAQFGGVRLGTGVPRLNIGDIRAFQMPLPPVAEQRRIVEKVESLLAEVNAVRDRLARVPEILKRFRQSVLAAACSGRLTEDWREAHPQEPTDDDAEIGIDGLYELPETWHWKRLGSALDDIESGKSFACVERPSETNEVGVVKVSAVTWGTYQESESKTCSDKSRVDPKLFVRPGDFLFSRANTIELVGACVIVEHTSRRIMLSDKILRFRIRAIDPHWILLALRSRHGRFEIERLATGNQNSMRNIGQERIREIRVPVPPAEEALEAVRRVNALFQAAALVEGALARAATATASVTQSILAKAFRGELVPTEAELARREGRDHEPASVLLERIKAEREKASLEKLKPVRQPQAPAKKNARVALAAKTAKKARG